MLSITSRPRTSRVLLLAAALALASTIACGNGEAARPAERPGNAGSPAIAGTMPAGAPATPAYPADSWMAALHPPMAGQAIEVACLDTDGDGRLDGADAGEAVGVDIPLVRTDTCLPPLRRRRAEWFVAGAALPSSCDDPRSKPVLVVAIAGGGSDLLDRDRGVSVGLIDITNGIRVQSAAANVPAGVILMTSAINFTDLPQTRMEQWLANDLAHRLDALPCLGVVLMGHSHGAVVVTSVMAALESQHGERLYGVILDRSLLYYDHEATQMPLHAPLLNVYQTNEGWHGEPLDTANVVNVDESAEYAPRDPRDGPLPLVAVAHPTLDDSIGVQMRVIAAVAAWVAAR